MYYYNLQVGKRALLFTYKYKDLIDIGTFCMVEFGKRIEKAVVVSMSSDSNKYEIKEIIEVLDEKLDKNLLELINFMHKYYLEPYSSLIPLIDNNDTDNKSFIEKENGETYEKYELSEEQEKVYQDIKNSDDKIHLINGVTGSGKTMIYINLIIDALKQGKSCIFLLPEISLTPQFIDKFSKTFKNNIAIWHSKLSEKKKKEYKEKLEKREIKLLIGTRSAIFQKIKNLEYIIIDEEQESTYKQETRPRYHIKNVAIKRCLIENAKLILGSATPSFETYYQVKKNLIKEHKLLNRYNKASLPTYNVIDLNESKSFLTEELINKINERIEKKEQVIILLNRKAYSTSVKCLDCKNIIECKNCSYKLTYYEKKKILKCNQCDASYFFKDKCQKCNSTRLEKIGFGTEKLEEQICQLFDEEKVLRMDSDTMNTNKKIQEAYKKFLNNEYNILVGTSLIAKGFHFPNVTLVCILNSDQMSAVADYKIQEKTYQLITQAAGRAGRSDKKGEVIIQTFNKDSDLIKAVINNDYDFMYESQMKYRKLLGFPPYTKHMKIIIVDKNENRLNKVSTKLYEDIVSNISDFSIVHPISNALIYKVSNKYRKNINVFYLKKNERKVKESITKILNKIDFNKGTNILIDVDPTSVI